MNDKVVEEILERVCKEPPWEKNELLDFKTLFLLFSSLADNEIFLLMVGTEHSTVHLMIGKAFGAGPGREESLFYRIKPMPNNRL